MTIQFLPTTIQHDIKRYVESPIEREAIALHIYRHNIYNNFVYQIYVLVVDLFASIFSTTTEYETLKALGDLSECRKIYLVDSWLSLNSTNRKKSEKSDLKSLSLPKIKPASNPSFTPHVKVTVPAEDGESPRIELINFLSARIGDKAYVNKNLIRNIIPLYFENTLKETITSDEWINVILNGSLQRMDDTPTKEIIPEKINNNLRLEEYGQDTLNFFQPTLIAEIERKLKKCFLIKKNDGIKILWCYLPDFSKLSETTIVNFLFKNLLPRIKEEFQDKDEQREVILTQIPEEWIFSRARIDEFMEMLEAMPTLE